QMAALAEGVLRAMVLARVKLALAIMLAVTVISAGAGLVAHQTRAAKPAPETQSDASAPPAERAAEPKSAGEKKVSTDLYGDSLPPGALARFGTLRWRAVGEVAALAFAPDGKTIVSLSTSGEAPVRGLCFFDMASGKRMKHLSPSDMFFQHIAFS